MKILLISLCVATVAFGMIGCGPGEKPLTKEDFKKTDPPPGWSNQSFAPKTKPSVSPSGKSGS